MFNRVSPNHLTARLDADFYKPEFVSNEAFLKKNGANRLAKLIDIKTSGYGVLPSSNEYCDEGIPLIRGGDLSFGEVISPSVCAPLSYKDGKGTAQEGDVLILIKGACIDGPEGVARVKQVNHGHLFNGSCFRLAFTNREIDGPFFIAYSQSKFFLKQKKRQVANTGVSYNDEESIHGYLIPELEIGVKKYIGDKIRQAEQLRAWAKRSEMRALELFNKQVDWSFEVLKVGKINKVLVSELNGRLDLKYNSPARLALLRHIKNKQITTTELVRLVDISAMIGWKGLTTEYYTDFGPWLLRGVEFRDGVIEFEKLVSVDRDKYLEQPQIHLKEGDIAFSKDGTIGKAIVIPELANDMAAGSTIARLRLKKVNEINPYYLELVLNHDFVQVQVESFATGIAQPHITQEWIAQLIIPRVKYEQVIGEYLSIHHLANNNSKILIQAAKTLVESLIEGQLTERQLIEAQQALEDGDNSLDQAILSKLSAEGYAIEGATPLFSDVDELYSLLEDAAQDEAEE